MHGENGLTQAALFSEELRFVFALKSAEFRRDFGQSKAVYPRSWRVGQSESTTDLAQKALRLPRFDQHLLHVSHTRQLKDEPAAKTGPLQFGQNSAPFDVAFTRRQMLITVAMIVVGVDHSQMPAQLVHDAVNFIGQISMAGIEKDTYLPGIHCSPNPEPVA